MRANKSSLVLLFKELLLVWELLLVRLEGLVLGQVPGQDVPHQAGHDHPRGGAALPHLHRVTEVEGDQESSKDT